MAENKFLEPKSTTRGTNDFISAAADYRNLSFSCFNDCVIHFDRDVVKGAEKVCMANCIQTHLIMFTSYAQYFAGDAKSSK
jgi:hypothetical protein